MATAFREISTTFNLIGELRYTIQSTPFHCKVMFYPQRNIGLAHIEYEGYNEKEIGECDLKLTAGIIALCEAKGITDLVLFPLEYVHSG